MLHYQQSLPLSIKLMMTLLYIFNPGIQVGVLIHWAGYVLVIVKLT